MSTSLVTVKVELEPNVILAEVPVPALSLKIFIFSLSLDETTIGKSIVNFLPVCPLTRISVVLFPEKVSVFPLSAVMVTALAASAANLICPNVTFTSKIGLPALITTFAFAAVGFPLVQFALLDHLLSPPDGFLKYF